MSKNACMKKRYLLYILILFPMLTGMFFSCRSKYHSPNPTPENYRLLGYTKVTTQGISYPYYIPTPVITENYRFVYNNGNDVSQMFFTSNDSNKMKVHLANLSIKFYYVSDTIYKTSTDLNTSTVMERDTFIFDLVNGQRQIRDAYFPFETHHFTYLGKLLATETVAFRDTNSVVSLNLTYTSYDNNFLYRLFDGQLHATFPDSGIRPDYLPGDVYRDTEMVLPLTVTWTNFHSDGTTAYSNHTGVGSYFDGLSGYAQDYTTVDVIDDNGVRGRTVYIPAGYANKLSYDYYDNYFNRPGDYMQLQSFATYGMNIYQTTNMVYTMISQYSNTHITYNIDADSKVGYTSAVIRDSVTKNVVNESYKLQYETY